MLFDSTAIILSLMASVITKWEANKFYSYGYGRVETLTGFINALALVFASGNIMWEAIERLISPTGDLGTENLLVVSVLGLVGHMDMLDIPMVTIMDIVTVTVMIMIMAIIP